MSIKAIETIYNGYRFRSRLEARWAVFFDTLGIKYQYEPEGFDLSKCELIDYFGGNIVEYTLDGDYWYLPDFYLPGQQCWIEIKPKYDLGKQLYKPEMLAQCQEKDVFVCMGEPYQAAVTYLWLTRNGWGLLSDYPFFKSSAFNEDSFTQFMRHHHPHAHYVFDSVGGNPTILTEYRARLLAAYEAARQARFGKGGKG